MLIVLSHCSVVCSHSTHCLRDARTGCHLPFSAGCSHGSADLSLNIKYPPGAIFCHTVLFLSILVNTSLLYSMLLGAKDPTDVWTGDIVLSALLVPLTPPEVPAISCLCMSDFFLRAILTGVLFVML